MKQHRIFIENLPETVSEADIRSKFEKFGDVNSIEIKERKVVTIKNSSCFFAYVNLITDDNALQKCFQTFSETPWCGEYVTLKIAKESFLERLKREREANLQKDEDPKTSKSTNVENINNVPSKSQNQITKKEKVDISSEIAEEIVTKNLRVKRKKKISVSSSDSSSSEEEISRKKVMSSLQEKDPAKKDTSEENILVRNTKRAAKFVNGLLKIEDVGNGPIAANQSTEEDKILDKHQAEAEMRRKKALAEKRKDYRQRKNAFSLFCKNPKIIKFTDDDSLENMEGPENNKRNSNKLTLFDNSDSETDNFDVGKIIEHRIKSDERFILDHRFSREEKDDNNHENDESEQKKAFEILGEVLGQKVSSKQNSSGNGSVPRYIRYDPSNPHHMQYELNNEKEQHTLKKKKKQINEKKVEEKQAPEVSKDRLHTVKVDLKAALGQTSGFSIRELYSDGKAEENKPVEEEAIPLPFGSNKFCLNDKNPYKYDSSDEEDETEQLEQEKNTTTQKPKKVWTEPFFLQENDFRFQEGLDFVKRIAEQAKGGDFDESRKQLKEIVKKKIRNAKRKSKPFQRKLGGSKKKKTKRWNKAMKR